MGHLICAKEIIDNYAAMKQRRAQFFAVLDRHLDCMSASITLSATRDVFPTEEMEADFRMATANFHAAIRAASDGLATVAGVIAAHCDPTKPPVGS